MLWGGMGQFNGRGPAAAAGSCMRGSHFPQPLLFPIPSSLSPAPSPPLPFLTLSPFLSLLSHAPFPYSLLFLTASSPQGNSFLYGRQDGGHRGPRRWHPAAKAASTQQEKQLRNTPSVLSLGLWWWCGGGGTKPLPNYAHRLQLILLGGLILLGLILHRPLFAQPRLPSQPHRLCALVSCPSHLTLVIALNG